MTEEVKSHEMVSADCPTTGDSLAFVLFWLGSRTGVGRTQEKVLRVRKAEFINALNNTV